MADVFKAAMANVHPWLWLARSAWQRVALGLPSYPCYLVPPWKLKMAVESGVPREQPTAAVEHRAVKPALPSEALGRGCFCGVR